MQLRSKYIIIIAMLFLSRSYAQTDDPGIVFSTLLNEITMAYERGMLKVNYLSAVNLPETETGEAAVEDSAFYPYNPDDGAKLTTVVKYKGYEAPFSRMFWYAKKQTPPFWVLEKYELEKTTQPKAEGAWMVFKTPGDFTMEFYADDELFYKFPFTVTKLPAVADGDPLDKYFLDGPWEEYAYLFYLGGMPTMKLKFVIWLRNKDHRPTKNIKVLGILMKDGAPVAKTSEGPDELSLTPQWQRFEFPLGATSRNNEGQVEFQGIRAQNLLQAPGNYELMITIDNQLYGTYPFTVTAESGFRLIEQQDPERTKPEERIHAGKDMIWLKRKTQ